MFQFLKKIDSFGELNMSVFPNVVPLFNQSSNFILSKLETASIIFL